MSRWGRDRGGRPWRRLRDAILLRDLYTCQQCQRVLPPSKLDCDHIIPLSQGGTDDHDNLRALCVPCHAAKSAREANPNAVPKVGCDADGWPA